MLKLRVVDNGDHAGLMWFPDDGQKIAGCRGFAIQRKLTRSGVEVAPQKRTFPAFLAMSIAS